MSAFAPAITTVSPSMMLPEIIMQYGFSIRINLLSFPCLLFSVYCADSFYTETL